MKTAITAAVGESVLELKATAAVGVGLSLLHALGLDATESLLAWIVVAVICGGLGVATIGLGSGKISLRVRIISMLRAVPIGFALAAIALWCASAFTDWPRPPEGIVAAVFFFCVYWGPNIVRLVNLTLYGSGEAVKDGEGIKSRITKD